MSLSRMLYAFVISLLLPWASGAWAQDFTLKAQFFLPKPHPVSKRLDQIYKEIEAASGGKVTMIRALRAPEDTPNKASVCCNNICGPSSPIGPTWSSSSLT